MKTMTPFTGLTTIRREMDRFFDRFGLEDLPDVGEGAGWAPALDVSETKDALVVKVETPGIAPEQIQLSFQDGVLSVRGEKTEEKEEKDQQYYRKERIYGAFARSVRLPAPVDAERIEASFKNGVLTVTLPKTAVAKTQRIPVKAA